MAATMKILALEPHTRHFHIFTEELLYFNTVKTEKMKRVTGIGGVFFRCKDPQQMKNWYQTHLGLETDQWGTNFEWRQAEEPDRKGFTQWSPVAENSTFFGASGGDFMMNYR